MTGFAALAALLGASVAQAQPLPAPEANPASRPSVASPAAAVTAGARSDFSVRAFVDGTSELVVRDGRVHWHHLQSSAPGRGGGHNEPTYIDGAPWVPEWPARNENTSCHCESSNSPIALSDDASRGPATVTCAEARGTVRVTAQPTEANGRETRITFEDPAAGPSWYECDVTYAHTETPGAHPLADVNGKKVPVLRGSIAFGSGEQGPGNLRGVVYFLPEQVTALPNFDALDPAGVLYTRQLNIGEQGYGAGFPGVKDRSQWFAIRYDGKFVPPVEGDYVFRLVSDDGSKLYVDTQLVADNDGGHGPRSVPGRIHLSHGMHAIRVDYYQGGGGLSLQLFVTPPGGAERPYDALALEASANELRAANANPPAANGAGAPPGQSLAAAAPGANGGAPSGAPDEATKNLPDDNAANGAIDMGFRQWSSGWMFDRYIPGSARAADRAFRNGTYLIRGVFTFVRMGRPITIPYAAAFTDPGGGYRLSNLCYNDISSGMTDCIDPSDPRDRQRSAMRSRQFLGAVVMVGMAAAMASGGEVCEKRYSMFGAPYVYCY